MVRLRRLGIAAVLVLAGLVVPGRAGATAAPVPAAAPVQFLDAAGLSVTAVSQLEPRLWEVRVDTAALGRDVRVRVLLPEGYDAAQAERYPVLYLFHGTGGGAPDWTQTGIAQRATAGLPLIVVMPDAGFDGNGGGWFTNWWDTGTGLGPSRWEDFHVDQLIPWVDANLHTVAGRSGRAVAGLSQGGFGAFSYAARHPDLFAAAASFSGAPDIASNPVVEAGATGVIEFTAVAMNGTEPAAMFGPHLTNEINWQGRNPATLVSNLRGMGLFLYTATGIPGALDGPQPDPAAMGIETLTHLSTMSFAQRADQAGVPYFLDDYVFGTHTFAYWAQDLRDFLPRMMAVFANPVTPSPVSYRSVEQSWTQWGWTVQNRRPAARSWSALSGAGPTGFTLDGTGTAAVSTPPVYRPGSTHAVRVSGLLGSTTRSLIADAAGRLHIDVLLSPLLPGLPGTVRVWIC